MDPPIEEMRERSKVVSILLGSATSPPTNVSLVPNETDVSRCSASDMPPPMRDKFLKSSEESKPCFATKPPESCWMLGNNRETSFGFADASRVPSVETALRSIDVSKGFDVTTKLFAIVVSVGGRESAVRRLLLDRSNDPLISFKVVGGVLLVAAGAVA
jgi:hypothetical protein